MDRIDPTVIDIFFWHISDGLYFGQNYCMKFVVLLISFVLTEIVFLDKQIHIQHSISQCLSGSHIKVGDWDWKWMDVNKLHVLISFVTSPVRKNGQFPRLSKCLTIQKTQLLNFSWHTTATLLFTLWTQTRIISFYIQFICLVFVWRFICSSIHLPNGFGIVCCLHILSTLRFLDDKTESTQCIWKAKSHKINVTYLGG